MLDETDLKLISRTLDEKLKIFKTVSRLESDVSLLRQLVMAQQREIDELKAARGESHDE